MKILVLLLYCVCSCLIPCISAADYYERLNLRPLPPSSLLASFNFRSNTSSASFEQQNFRYFPRSLGQILKHANTHELHLRFSLGRWDAESWGARPWGGGREGGTGVELWAWVQADTDEEADARWTTLTNALSGLFCASLNFIDSTRTIRPVKTFEPYGDHSPSVLPNLHLLHGTLPREVVCTENLTPFLKLLPCKGKAGISSLLDGHKLFDASWQSMSIDIRPVCPSGSHAPGDCILEIEQTIDMVLDIERSKRQHDNPIPRPVPAETLVCDTSKPYHNSETCYPLDERASQGWSISDIFGRYIHGTCPLTESAGSESESVCIEVPHARDVYTSVPGNENKHEGGFSRCFRLEAAEDFQLLLPQQTLNETFPLPQPLLYAERSFTGHGQERGGVQTLLTNPLSNSAVEFVYLESLPWFMKPYLHTLHVSLSSSSHITTVTEEDLIKEMYYRPALDRHRPTHLELVIRLPPDSSAVLTYDFEKAILRYTEYPPDANRGFDVPPAVLRIISPNDTLETVYLRTTSLLLNLPTPDFSMPYNVIILTSTVMALAFGMVFNLLVRRFVGKDEVDEVAGVKGKLLALFGKMRRSFTKKGKGENRKNE